MKILAVGVSALRSAGGLRTPTTIVAVLIALAATLLSDPSAAASHTDEQDGAYPTASTVGITRDGVPGFSHVQNGSLIDGNPATTERLDISSPVDLTAAVSQLRFADGGAEHIALARADEFADSLAASPLMADGPLLLTPGDSLSPVARAEIVRVLPSGGTVYLLGGTSALSEGVETTVRQLGVRTVRLAGADRIATSISVLAELSVLADREIPVVAVARAFGEGSAAWADSISAGGWAAETRTPIVLTQTAELDGRVRTAIEGVGVTSTVILGGTAAIDDGVASSLPNPRRVAGEERSATAAAMAEELWDGIAAYLVINGFSETGWVSGLAAAGLSATLDAPILLADADRIPGPTLARLGLGCGQGTPAVETALIGDTIALGQALILEIDRHDGGLCAVDAGNPTPDVPGPSGLLGSVLVGPGHIYSAGTSRTYWVESANDRGSCITGGEERIVVQDAEGRRQTSFPGVTYQGLSVELSSDEQHATVEGFCDDGYFLKGYVDVTSTGDLVNFRSVGNGSYTESGLRWREDGLIYATVDRAGSFDDPILLDLILINPRTAETATLVSFPPDMFVQLVHHQDPIVAVSYFDSGSRVAFIDTRTGQSQADYSIEGGYLTTSPDGEWSAYVPYDGTLVTSYRTSDLSSDVLAPVAEFAPAGEFISGSIWSASGQLAMTLPRSASTDVLVWDPDSRQAAGVPVLTSPEQCASVHLTAWASNESEVFLGLDEGCGKQRTFSALSVGVRR